MDTLINVMEHLGAKNLKTFTTHSVRTNKSALLMLVTWLTSNLDRMNVWMILPISLFRFSVNRMKNSWLSNDILN